jgi:hypothetical protein
MQDVLAGMLEVGWVEGGQGWGAGGWKVEV